MNDTPFTVQIDFGNQDKTQKHLLFFISPSIAFEL